MRVSLSGRPVQIAAALLFVGSAAVSGMPQKPPLPEPADVCDAAPGTRAICFPRIAAEYNVLRSGDVVVTETLTVRFHGDWNGVTRELRARATSHDLRPAAERDADPDRSFRDVAIDVLGATDLRGSELRLESESGGDVINLRIWVPGASDATRTVVLRYRIHDGVTFFDDHDEFYWNVLGVASTAPVATATVRVIPPLGATGLRSVAFQGPEGSTLRADARVEGPVAVATTAAPLEPGHAFTIVAGWDPGLIERPGAVSRLLGWLRRYWSFALPVLSLGFMWSMWRRRGRDPAMLSIVTRYEPPDDLTPGEVGTLLDERADMRDVTATLVDLAVQGHLRIEEVEGKKLLGMEFGEDYRFVQTTPATRMRPTRPHELKLIEALFDGRGQVELSDLKNEFYKDLPGIRDAMMDSLTMHGVYARRPDRVRTAWVVGALVTGFLLFMLLMATASAPLAIVLVPPLTALPMAVFGWLMPARTVKGTRIIERLRGFREFLSRVDGDRLRRMKIDPAAFERILPFAMAMGVEKKWGEAFEGLAHEPPSWYHSTSGGGFRPARFASNLSRMSTATASTMSSQPQSSGGSGGSGFGGGSSGGGGGGGGVGGF